MKTVAKFIYGALLIFIFLLMYSFYSSNKHLPFSKWNSSLVYGESLGMGDGYGCEKTVLKNINVSKAISALELNTLNEDQKISLSTTTKCHNVPWWDISFPKEAQYYSLSYGGQVLKMAAWKDGYLYYTNEER